MSEKLKETEDIILDKTPSFVELQEYYEQRIEEYDKLKKHVVGKNVKFWDENNAFYLRFSRSLCVLCACQCIYIYIYIYITHIFINLCSLKK